MKPLSSAWTQHLSGTDKEDFERIVRNSTKLLSHLQTILEDNERQLFNLNSNLNDFKDPNWSHKQAFRNGQLSTLRMLREIVTL